MRIGIDATSLLLRSAGVKTWTWHWIDALRRCAKDERIEAFPFIGDLPPLTHERSVLPPLATSARIALILAMNARGSPLVNWVARRFDLLHLSNQIRFAPRNTRCTATIHDMTCWIMPEVHTPGNIQADRLFADRVLGRAAGLIAVSQNTRADAVRLLDIDADRIHVIYPGIADSYFTAQPRPAARPYVLYVGSIEPRKNLGALLNAWAAMRPAVREAHDLLIAGPEGWAQQETMDRLRRGENGVRYLGYVPEAELPGLMAGASVFAYPSLYEGFGFPVAQAMAARVPILTSNVSSLPEIAGASAVLVDPRSEAEIRGGLERLLTSPSLRTNLARQGAVRAAEFRWDVCARKSLEFFHGVG
jgi:glycosyltransferase involved in cell wall biosynthesis